MHTLPLEQVTHQYQLDARILLPLILDHNGEQLTVDMPGQLVSNDIEVMADGIRNGLGIGRLFEPVYQLQPDKEAFIPVAISVAFTALSKNESI